MPDKIDAHHHFWKYDPLEYDWITDDMKVIRRNFLPADLDAELKGRGIDGVVSVQARQTVDETKWLLDLAQQHECICTVISSVPLSDPRMHTDLDQFKRNRQLNTLRYMIQVEHYEH